MRNEEHKISKECIGRKVKMKQLFVTFPSGKLFLDQFLSLFLLNSQEFFRYKIAKSQGFRYSSFKVKSHSDSIRVWFGLLESYWFLSDMI